MHQRKLISASEYDESSSDANNHSDTTTTTTTAAVRVQRSVWAINQGTITPPPMPARNVCVGQTELGLGESG